jgi:hypothetical protein
VVVLFIVSCPYFVRSFAVRHLNGCVEGSVEVGASGWGIMVVIVGGGATLIIGGIRIRPRLEAHGDVIYLGRYFSDHLRRKKEEEEGEKKGKAKRKGREGRGC